MSILDNHQCFPLSRDWVERVVIVLYCVCQNRGPAGWTWSKIQQHRPGPCFYDPQIVGRAWFLCKINTRWDWWGATLRTYCGFCILKRSEFLLPLDGKLIHHRLPPPPYFVSILLGGVRQCEWHNVQWHRPLDPESHALELSDKFDLPIHEILHLQCNTFVTGEEIKAAADSKQHWD